MRNSGISDAVRKLTVPLLFIFIFPMFAFATAIKEIRGKNESI